MSIATEFGDQCRFAGFVCKGKYIVTYNDAGTFATHNSNTFEKIDELELYTRKDIITVSNSKVICAYIGGRLISVITIRENGTIYLASTNVVDIGITDMSSSGDVLAVLFDNGDFTFFNMYFVLAGI